MFPKYSHFIYELTTLSSKQYLYVNLDQLIKSLFIYSYVYQKNIGYLAKYSSDHTLKSPETRVLVSTRFYGSVATGRPSSHPWAQPWQTETLAIISFLEVVSEAHYQGSSLPFVNMMFFVFIFRPPRYPFVTSALGTNASNKNVVSKLTTKGEIVSESYFEKIKK